MPIRTVAKLGIIMGLSLLLMLPLTMIQGLIGERQGLRDGVLREMARESVDAQLVAGPIILVPYKQRVVDLVSEEKEGKTTTTRRERQVEGRLALMPERLAIAGGLTSEMRHRGIYQAILYNAGLVLDGQFVVPTNYGIEAGQAGDYEFGPAALVLGISDPRGIGTGLQLEWNGTPTEFQPGANAPGLRGGATAPLGRL